MNSNKQETKVFARGAVIARQMRFIDGGQTTDNGKPGKQDSRQIQLRCGRTD